MFDGWRCRHEGVAGEPSERTAFPAIRTRRRSAGPSAAASLTDSARWKSSDWRFYISVYICTSIANQEKPVIYQPCRRLRHERQRPAAAAGRVRRRASRTPHEQVENQQGVNYENHRSLAAPLRRRPRPAAAGGSRAGADESVPERAGSDVRDSQRQRRSVRCRQHVGVELRERLRRRHGVLPDDRRLVRDLAICPGFTATQSSIAWIGQRLASHGFVVMTINTNSTFDQPPSRATQLMAALRYLTNSSNSTVRARVDANRLGVAGHSMGGGGTLMAARDNPSLKAAVPMTPWSQTKSFSTVRVPTHHLRRGERFGCAGLVALDSVLHQPARLARQGVRGAQRRQPSSRRTAPIRRSGATRCRGPSASWTTTRATTRSCAARRTRRSRRRRCSPTIARRVRTSRR